MGIFKKIGFPLLGEYLGITIHNVWKFEYPKDDENKQNPLGEGQWEEYILHLENIDDIEIKAIGSKDNNLFAFYINSVRFWVINNNGEINISFDANINQEITIDNLKWYNRYRIREAITEYLNNKDK